MPRFNQFRKKRCTERTTLRRAATPPEPSALSKSLEKGNIEDRSNESDNCDDGGGGGSGEDEEEESDENSEGDSEPKHLYQVRQEHCDRFEYQRHRPAFLEKAESVLTHSPGDSESVSVSAFKVPSHSTRQQSVVAERQVQAVQSVEPELEPALKLVRQRQLPVVQSTISDDRSCESEFEKRRLKNFFRITVATQAGKEEIQTRKSKENGARLIFGQGSDSNPTLEDYQMQLMLLEQQNKKRLRMARQEQDSTGYRETLEFGQLSRLDGPPIPAKTSLSAPTEAVTMMGQTSPSVGTPKMHTPLKCTP